jgi:hypothetical protein
MGLKSISSFIASVLLIGFTIASGIIVYYFFTTLPKVQTTEVSSQASKVLSCAGATFDVKVRNCNLLNGLVLWMPMDEGSGTITYDYSGYGNNGTLYSGTNVCSNPPTSGCPTWVDGVIGKALSFDGVDDYVYVNSTSISFDFQDLTISAWIKLKGGTGEAGINEQIVANNPCGWNSGWEFKVDVVNNQSGFEYANPNEYQTNTFIDTIYELHRWYFVAVVTYIQNGVRYIKWFINGTLIGTIQNANATILYDSLSRYNLTIGGLNGNWGCTVEHFNSHFFNGTIDEIRIHNRALSEDEIKQLYYNGLTNKFNITIGLLNFGFADLGNSFTAIVYLKNGTILQLPLVLDNNLNRGYYLEKTLTIDGYYPSYGLVDKIMVCSNDCQGVCSEIKINNQC